jgi:hypothetical protein
MKAFARGPVSFLYPDGWQVSAEDDGGAWTASFESGGTAFFVASLRPEMEDAGQLADETLTAMRAEFQELDAEPVVVSLGGWPALGHDIDFLTLDTPTHCMTRCVNTVVGPLLFLAQVSELDRAAQSPHLLAVLASVTITDEE